MKSKVSKACDISKQVKDKVWDRDDKTCILCGSPQAMPNAHFIPRSLGGLGAEENIVTLCMDCHRAYDQSDKRKYIAHVIEGYLKSMYSGWNKEDLIYRREL